MWEKVRGKTFRTENPSIDCVKGRWLQSEIQSEIFHLGIPGIEQFLSIFIGFERSADFFLSMKRRGVYIGRPCRINSRPRLSDM